MVGIIATQLGTYFGYVFPAIGLPVLPWPLYNGIYVPEQGYGFFLFDGPDGWKLPFGILLWHLIYGLFLGLLWDPSDSAASAAEGATGEARAAA